MGALADAALLAGGTVIGVMPRALVERGTRTAISIRCGT
jgi:predicted Rossmann-fold nucleotide-binding protein